MMAMASMSLINRLLRCGAFLIALVGLIATPGLAQKILSCPSALKVVASAVSIEGWKGSTTTADHDFEGVSIYNGKDGGQEYDLAPDDQEEKGKTIILTWKLKGYRTMNMFMRCRYQSTPLVLSIDLPAALQTCTFRAEIDAKGNIVGKPAAGCK